MESLPELTQTGKTWEYRLIGASFLAKYLKKRETHGEGVTEVGERKGGLPQIMFQVLPSKTGPRVQLFLAASFS